MALAFGLEFGPQDRPIGRRAFGRDARAARRPAANVSPETIRRENAALVGAFDDLAEAVGVTAAERAVLLGGARDPSRLILALELLGAARDLCGGDSAALAWLRATNPQAPFNEKTPLTLIASQGQLGAEIALIFLRARLRKAMC
ncbi:hypothetical protein M2323_001656 [Rhodoblastus acidophilus]|uniref:antitoxin Xre/MbcA/ParS toxin-binding domain-containing protein n=1 Tax=Rhodoblastus acidophilus TaxID=1074 RepID=UPI00222487A9|nr:antitoxin Xre/MbcA/ParS toxin-binding domain-containing protein [Rhodoblastus acidophilus]MCW2284043.1 hypothetical protein [Rhodoblastus acidophilus]MCW2332739.1 hypothetical protein [Rhodoblastus acidophilus]